MGIETNISNWASQKYQPHSSSAETYKELAEYRANPELLSIFAIDIGPSGLTASYSYMLLLSPVQIPNKGQRATQGASHNHI